MRNPSRNATLFRCLILAYLAAFAVFPMASFAQISASIQTYLALQDAHCSMTSEGKVPPSIHRLDLTDSCIYGVIDETIVPFLVFYMRLVTWDYKSYSVDLNAVKDSLRLQDILSDA